MKIFNTLLLGLLLTLVFGFASSKTLEQALIPTHHQVIISGFEFVPKKLNVSTGDKISWINKDIVPHNIAVNSTLKVLSPEIASGETFSIIVKDSLSYICGLHPSMQGKLIVN